MKEDLQPAVAAAAAASIVAAVCSLSTVTVTDADDQNKNSYRKGDGGGLTGRERRTPQLRLNN